jgi:peptide deformylase
MSSRAYDDPELERRRLAALGQIRQYGDPVLRTPALDVTVFDQALKEEARRMTTLMREARGVGLAAPQVGALRRVVVAQLEEDGAVTVICNPRIVWRSEEEEVATEGCLSLGDDLAVEVSRALAVRVEAQDAEGTPFELELEGYGARVIQHEVDHLDGILIIDRAAPEERREALRALRAGG